MAQEFHNWSNKGTIYINKIIETPASYENARVYWKLYKLFMSFHSTGLLELKSSFKQIIWYSVQFSCSVVSNSLQPHELQHARPPCPSPTPRVHPDSRPLTWWCHPGISSSLVSFSFCPQSLPAAGSFQMSQLFALGGQSIGSFSFSISPSNEHQGLISFRMDWLDLLSVQGILKSLLQHHSSKASIFGTQLSSQSNSHIHTWPQEKP